MMEISSLTETFNALKGCCLHDPQWTPEEVTDVLAAFWSGDYGVNDWQPLEDVKEGSESESAIAVRLKDGSYGLLTESEDYTGHGCRCDAFTGRYPTLADLIFHCEDPYRDLMAEAINARSTKPFAPDWAKPIPPEPVDMEQEEYRDRTWLQRGRRSPQREAVPFRGSEALQEHPGMDHGGPGVAVPG